MWNSWTILRNGESYKSFVTSVLKKLIILHLVNKFPAFLGIRSFTNVFIKSSHWTLSINYHVEDRLHFSVTIPSRLSVFASSLPVKMLEDYIYFPRACFTLRPTHAYWSHHLNNIWWSSILPHAPGTSLRLYCNIHRTTPFSDNLIYSSLTVKVQDPYTESAKYLYVSHG